MILTNGKEPVGSQKLLLLISRGFFSFATTLASEEIVFLGYTDKFAGIMYLSTSVLKPTGFQHPKILKITRYVLRARMGSSFVVGLGSDSKMCNPFVPIPGIARICVRLRCVV